MKKKKIWTVTIMSLAFAKAAPKGSSQKHPMWGCGVPTKFGVFPRFDGGLNILCTEYPTLINCTLFLPYTYIWESASVFFSFVCFKVPMPPKIYPILEMVPNWLGWTLVNLHIPHGQVFSALYCMIAILIIIMSRILVPRLPTFRNSAVKHNYSFGVLLKLCEC